MPPAGTKPKSQKPQKRSGTTKHRATPPPRPPSPLEAFFAMYAPLFEYNPTASASLEFYRLCDKSNWEKDDPKRETAHKKFKDALVQQFNIYYGTDPNDLGSWQTLCHVVSVDPVPNDLPACREAGYSFLILIATLNPRQAVRYTFVNLVDLVDARKTGAKVKVFESERTLSEYTNSTGKYFPRNNAKAGGLLRHLLRHIYRPCDAYVYRSWTKRRGRR